MLSSANGSGRARLADIAKQAGVSEATVSRVLNDRPGVSATAKQLVLTALDVLGFERPERLRKRSAGLVGLVIPELDNPIFPAFAQMIETALSQHGFTPVLCTQTPGGTTEDEYVEMLLGQQVAGIIFVSSRNADTTADPHLAAGVVSGLLYRLFCRVYAVEAAVGCGATGAVLMTKLLHILERTSGRYGLQSMCIGFGMGTATIIERLH